MLPYAAYLRVYEPLNAFAEPEKSIWAAYAASEKRPRRVGALDVEHTHALRRVIAVPPIVAPVRESRDAYVRRAEDVTYICPWETRLRSWLAFDRFRDGMSEQLAEMFVPRRVAEQAEGAFDRWKRQAGTLSPHILSSTWQVPLAWFVPFVAKERWLVLGAHDDNPGGGPTTATPVRTLIYVTPMAQARRRVARALVAVRRHAGEHLDVGEVESVGRWLEEFHPHSLVELDYGGLVHLLDDAALRADESVAEVAAAITGMETGQTELAVAMHKRVVARWRVVRALESAN
ncbi:hypothetical protein OG417_04545 [Actinoallomurus sp. NBC_01490]|uniref:hypothetical protein n=1 Tax=Actinoallomurus sp. NBC_01490 TaxID=2903557 RepID=UPI002E376F88|nr:hypothetical protein [Actinoallomurus sp. NBC_01490]